MTDGELKHLILKKLYDLRERDGRQKLDLEELGISPDAYNRAGRLLAQDGLIEWQHDMNFSGDDRGAGRITSRGSQAIERQA